MRSLERIVGIAMMFVPLSVRLGRTCIVITVQVSADLSLWLDRPMLWAPNSKARPSRLFPVLPGREVGYRCVN